jgi:hypothetical protein
VLVLAVLAVYVLLVQVPKDKAAASVTPSAAPATYLWTARADQINGVHLADKVKGQGFDLIKAPGGAWTLAQPGPQPADQSRAAADIDSLTTLTVNSVITTATDLAPFGVLSPTFTMEVDLADGSKLKAVIGNKAPAGSDYYALREGEKQVLLLSSVAHDTLTNLLASPPIVPPTATLTPGPGTPSVTPPLSATLPVTATVAAGTTTPTQTAVATVTAQPSATASPTAAATATVTASPTGSPARTPARTPTARPKSSATP